jgi:hypothetical protein
MLLGVAHPHVQPAASIDVGCRFPAAHLNDVSSMQCKGRGRMACAVCTMKDEAQSRQMTLLRPNCCSLLMLLPPWVMLRRHVTFILGAAAELTGVLLAAAVIDRVARHCLVSYGLLLAGASCLAAASGVTQLAQCLLAAGKFGCTGEVATAGQFY